MSETVLVAVLSLTGTLAGSMFGILTANRLTAYRIEQLEKKVDEYNNVKTRTTELETWKSSIDHELKEIKEKITKLESLHMQSC
jgi:sensor histidine kinase YesM